MLFRLSLKEEQAMADAMRKLIRPITERYLSLTVSGAKADR